MKDLQNKIQALKHSPAKEGEITDKMEELKAQSELLEIEKKAFEDLEFQQLESQAHDEELKEELAQEIECFKETIAQRQVRFMYFLCMSFLYLIAMKVYFKLCDPRI